MMQSLLNLFIIATCEGWSAFMIEAWDAYEVDYQPVPNHNKAWSIFFIFHFFFGMFMVFNTFIGILIE